MNIENMEVKVDESRVVVLQKGQEGFHECKLSGWRPLFNMHMHIQSNNVCPLPLAWTAADNKGVTMGTQLTNRRSVNFSGGHWLTSIAAVGRFGKLGRLRTDIIAGIYWGAAVDSDLPHNNYWIFDNSDLQKAAKVLNGVDITLKTGAIAVGTSIHPLVGAAVNQTIYQLEPGSETEKSSIKNLSAPSFNTLLSKKSLPLMDHDTEQMAIYYNMAGIDNHLIMGSYKPGNLVELMSIGLLMDMSFAHYWGKLGLPVCIAVKGAQKDVERVADEHEKVKKKLEKAKEDTSELRPKSLRYFITNCARFNKNKYISYEYYNDDNRIYPRALTPSELSIPHLYQYQQANRKDIAEYKNMPEIIVERGDRSLLDRKYVHLLEELPGDEAKWMEEYDQQVLYSSGAVVRFPLKQYCFYHYDPKRYYTEGQLKKQAEELTDNHAFFYTRQNWFKNKLYLESVEELNGSVEQIVNYLKLKTGRKEHSTIWSKNILSGGLFWAIKMYPRLGYRPDDFVLYPHLNNLYHDCSEKKIPIITHCGRGPFKIGDYFNYLRYDDEVSKKLSDEEYEYHFSDHHTSPGQWKKVIEKYPALTVSFAHFAGYDLWEDIGDFGELHCDVERLQNQLLANSSACDSTFNEIKEMESEVESINTKDEKLFLEEWKLKKPHQIMISGSDIKRPDSKDIQLHYDNSTYLAEEKQYQKDVSRLHNERMKLKQRREQIDQQYESKTVNFQSQIDEHNSLQARLKEEKQKIDLLDVLANLPKGKKCQSWTERMAVFIHWIRKIVDMMEVTNNVYVDLACFTISNDTKIPEGRRLSGSETLILNNLHWLFRYAEREGKKDLFKERVLMGTDWYMSEAAKITADGPMLGRMFNVMQQLSHLLEIDCWHQFTVINPLRFMGMLEGNSSIDMSRLKKLQGKITSFSENPVWCKKACALEITPKDTNETMNRIIEGFENFRLLTAENMFKK